jgi:protease secretion system membrane fusion protein
MSENQELLNPQDDKAHEDKKESKSNALVVHFRELDKKAEGWIAAWNPYHPDVIKYRPMAPVNVEESKIRRSAAKIFLISFGLFVIWATFAPIDAGVTTQGTVMVSGYRKTLQHPTGGVIQEILVKDGDIVKEGDILIRVNPLKAQADLSAAQLQYLGALVTEARLKAERKNQNKITWPDELDTFGNDPRVAEAKGIQQKLFDTRRTEIVAVLNGKRLAAATLSEEAKNNATLAQEGYVPKAQANQALRSKIDAELQLNQLEAAYYKDIDLQLAQIQQTRDALKDKFEAVAFDRDLTSIRAPVTGTLIGLKLNTVGGTIPAGQVIAEVVPAESALVVDAQVPPNLIDKVKVGQFADMHFTAFNANTTPVIPGKVIMVGADKLPPSPGAPPGASDFYLAKVEATPQGLKELGKLKIQPGMSTDVIFKTGERSFMSYLFKPITDKLAKAFKD